jgi:ABC-type tungstate transport system permease subunit
LGRNICCVRQFGLGLFALLTCWAPAQAADALPETTIILASTTSVDNSGLLAAILPEFTKTTGITVHVLALGTGQALDTARRGDADIVLVHDPEAEQKFLDDANGDQSPRRSPGTISSSSDPPPIRRISPAVTMRSWRSPRSPL